MHHYIYKITNKINSKIYIGKHSTHNIDDEYMGSGKNIILAIEKYGIENFQKEILEFFDSAEAALLKESEIVNEEFLKREDVYNTALGGSWGSWHHVNTNPEIKEKLKKSRSNNMIEVNKRLWNDPTFVQRQREKLASQNRERVKNQDYAGPWNKGKKTPDETRQKISKARKGKFVGEKSPMLGRIWMTNLELKKMKRVKKDDIELQNKLISEGWVMGHLIGTRIFPKQ